MNEIIQLCAERTFITRFAAQIRDSRSILNARRTADKPESCRQEQDLISRQRRGVCARRWCVFMKMLPFAVGVVLFTTPHPHPWLGCPHMENEPS